MNLFFVFINMLNIKSSLLYVLYMYILLVNNWEKNVLFIFFWSFFCDIFLGFLLGRSFLIYYLSTYIMHILKKNFFILCFWRMFFFVVFFSFLIRMISFYIDNIILGFDNVNNFILLNSFFDGFLWFFFINRFLRNK